MQPSIQFIILCESYTIRDRCISLFSMAVIPDDTDVEGDGNGSQLRLKRSGVCESL